MIKHGRESLVKIADGKYVSKGPLPGRSVAQKREWLSRQQRAAETIQKLHEIGNDAYGVPHIKSIDSKKFYVLEERMSGVPLSPLLFRSLDKSAREKVIDSLAQFYADMHSINIIPNPVEYKMSDNLEQFVFLKDFIETDMFGALGKSDTKFVKRMYENLLNISYETRLVWSHCDLFENNVLYDYKTQKFNVIDFTDAGTNFLHYDMLRCYAYDLGAVNSVRAKYLKYRDAHNLPMDFTDDGRCKKISQYHSAASVFEQMDEELECFQYLGKSERKQKVTVLRQQIEKLRKCERGF